MASRDIHGAGTTGGLPLPAGVTVDAIQIQLDRILANGVFAQTERLRRLLRYIVEQTVTGHGDQLKEYTLAVDVFERGESFDRRLDAVVRVQAGRLRAKLLEFYAGEGRSDQVVIELPKGSYVPVFRRREQATANEARSSVRAAWLLAALALAVGLGVLLSVSLWKRGPATVMNPAAASAGASVAVLPFTNLSPEPGQDYFCDGIVEEITNALSKVPGLRVAARTSSFQFKGKNADVHEIARKLNVGVVLEGSVRKTGDRLRITAQLVNGVDGYHLWSETYERPMRDVFATQDEISRAIVTALQKRMVGSPHAPPLKRYTESLEAYDFYLRALHESLGNADSVPRAMQYFQQALARDARYAPAYAGVAYLYNRMASEAAEPPRKVMPKAREAAERALRIDEGLPEAHIALAYVKYAFDWDWSGAEWEYRRALELNPNSTAAHTTYALYLSRRDRPAEALTQIESIRLLDPLSPSPNPILALIYFYARQYDRLILHCRTALTATPDAKIFYYWLGRAYAEKSQFAEALAALEKVPRPSERYGKGFGTLASTYARAGQRARALELLAETMDRSKQAYVQAEGIAMIHLSLGDRDRALEWLERAVAERDDALAGLKVDPAFDPLRGDPRFQAVLRRVHLD